MTYPQQPPVDDDAATPARGVYAPPPLVEAPHEAAPIPPATGPVREPDDAAGVVTGIALALLVHALVVGAAFRLGTDEGNVSRAARAAGQAAQPDQVIETHLLKRGGGEWDPRRIVHRVAPVLAERAAPEAIRPTRDPTAVTLSRDAGAQEYMAAITGQNRQGSGNQDLAERLAHLAAAEREADPGGASGPGDPSGSAVGDTTDPNLATHDAFTKIDEFLRLNIHLSSALTDRSQVTVVFRIRLAPDGTIQSALIATPSGNESLDADILVQAQRLAETHAQVPNLSPQELTVVSNRNINVRVPVGRAN